MWPKALAQILELLPHVTRLVPLADRFLSSRQGGDEAGRRAVEELSARVGEVSEGLKADIAQVTASHAGLYRQVNEAAAKAEDAAREARGARETVATLEARLARIEAVQARQGVLLTVAVVLLAIVVLLLPFLFSAMRAR